MLTLKINIYLRKKTDLTTLTWNKTKEKTLANLNCNVKQKSYKLKVKKNDNIWQCIILIKSKRIKSKMTEKVECVFEKLKVLRCK